TTSAGHCRRRRRRRGCGRDSPIWDNARFPIPPASPMTATAARLIEAAQQLSNAVGALRFSAPVSHVYNPLDYAWSIHRNYLERFGAGSKRVIFLGMNPGPFG